MSKKEESIKLNLGTDEEDEEEEESEYEDDEVAEEENEEDEGIVDFGNGFVEKNLVIGDGDPIESTPILNNTYKADLTKLEPEVELLNVLSEKELEEKKEEIFNDSKIISPLKVDILANKPINISGAHSHRDNNHNGQPGLKKMLNNKVTYAPSESINNRKKIKTSEKTVFTRISEELFEKFVSNKKVQNKKTSAYEYLINDMFLNRVVEKNDKESAVKFNNFVNRNKEFRDKKQLKLQERTDKIATELNATYTGKPNGKNFDKTELRDRNEYLQDQLKYYQTRDMNIKQQQEEMIKTTDLNMKQIPDISTKSKKMAEKRLNADNKEVHDRLFQDKIHKEKKKSISENTKHDSKEKSKFTADKETTAVKKSKTEIQEMVDKLFRDAEQRKENKEKVLNDKIKIKEVYHMYDSEDELTLSASKLKILDKFVRWYELTLNRLFNQKKSIHINFDEFANLMVNLGLTEYDHQITQENKENLKLLKKEFNLLKDAWKILAQGNNNYINDKDENFNPLVNSENENIIEKIDTNQLLVFCASLLGLYKGENNEVNLGQITQADKNTLQNTQLNTEEKLDSHTIEVNFDTLPNETIHHKNLSTFGSTTSPQKIERKRIKIPNRFSTPNEIHTFSSLTGASFSIAASNKKSKQNDFYNTDVKKNKNKNLLKVVVPELDMARYQYSKDTTRQIKIIFKYMYDNRVRFLYEAKQKIKMEKLSSIEKNELNYFRQTFKPSEKLRQSAENFKNRVYKEIESEIMKKSDPNSQSPTHLEGKIGRSLRLDEVYNILRKKKENETAKIKIQMEEEELKDCTFQPNYDKNVTVVNAKSVNETINKLYQDGVSKNKLKNSDDKKDIVILPSEFPFAPKVNAFNSHVFEVNPLAHDKFIEKEHKRFEKARVEKKLTEIQKKKGVTNLKILKNLDALLLDDSLPNMNFHIENKFNKDTIENQNKSEKRNKSATNRSDFFKTTKSKAREPLLNIEVNIDDHNRVEKLEIYSNDDPMLVADKFCHKYGLAEDKKLRLQKVIEEKLSENLGSNSHRS